MHDESAWYSKPAEEMAAEAEVFLGISAFADGMSIARVWTCRYSK